MSKSIRPRLSELLAQINAMDDVRDLVLVARAATDRLELAHARTMRASLDDVGVHVEIVALNKDLDGLTGTIVGSTRPSRRGDTHFVNVELDELSAATLAERSEKWREILVADTCVIPVSRSNLSRIWE